MKIFFLHKKKSFAKTIKKEKRNEEMMKYIAKLYSSKPNEISNYLNRFFQALEIPKTLKKPDLFEWESDYNNPIDLVDLINFHQDQCDDFQVELWICLDKNLFIHVTKEIADQVVRYIYERFPY